MLPLPGGLTEEPQESEFLGAAAYPISRSTSYADGGVAVGDASQGMMYQVWEARIEGGGTSARLYSDNGVDQLIRTGSFITDISLAFDREMRPVLAFVDSGVAYLQWFNPSIGGIETYELGNAGVNFVNPKITFDYKIDIDYQGAGLVLAYINDGALCVRQENTQFRTEEVLRVGPYLALNRVGLSVGYRLQFQCTLRDY